MKLNRSYLYVPAEAGSRLQKSTARGADAVIADLEDAVAPASKGAAREAAAAWLTEQSADDTVERWIRVNPGEMGLDDIRLVFRSGIDGFCVAKVDSAAELALVDEAIAEAERQHGVAVGTTPVIPLIETARGLRNVFEIAESPRVALLQIGEIDLAADLGITPGPEGLELASIRSTIVVASVTAGLLPPVGAVSPDYQDLAALTRSTEQLKAAGFVGRAAIHPAQLPTIHETFAVSSDDESAARALVAHYEEAKQNGTGAITGPDGRMVDEATVRQAHRTIWLAEARHDATKTPERTTP